MERREREHHIVDVDSKTKEEVHTSRESFLPTTAVDPSAVLKAGERNAAPSKPQDLKTCQM